MLYLECKGWAILLLFVPAVFPFHKVEQGCMANLAKLPNFNESRAKLDVYQTIWLVWGDPKDTLLGMWAWTVCYLLSFVPKWDKVALIGILTHVSTF